ncbi:hypothetical protein KI809_10510 [Geobacter pelophilus]|uniref:Uncharacterized protein n=1 Tax=Geoanaerobacter pelophilus TaxID=60036 RepID=A0AAW4L8U1_9BACT|nr:hypothetical protein [Geoanaerobacter pelophilus]MBT0664731.1 hypothetical protein [Geoanaerobacter pelophilus]
MNIFIVLIMVIFSCPTVFAATSPDKIVWIDKGKVSVKAKLKDPESVKFRNVYFHKGVDGIPMTCGEVNSKNGYGGKSGFQKFISGGKADLTYLQEQVKDFDIIWQRFCN